MTWNKRNNNGRNITSSSINGNIKIDGNDIEVYDDSNKADVIHLHLISDITDVDATNKVNGNVLMVNSSTNKIELKPLPSGTGSGATNLDGLTDVDVTTNSPVEGDVLQFKSGIWKPAESSLNMEDGSFNLVNPLKIDQTGYFKFSDGSKTVLTGYGSTDWITVEFGATYRKNWASDMTFWDSNKNFIIGFSNMTDFTINDSRIKYVRSSLNLSFGKWAMTRGTAIPLKNQYVPYEENTYRLPSDKFKIDQQFSPNSKIPLFIETHVSGGNQPVHPSVISFDSPWNGYKYWMAYTPFPDKNDQEENPCIAVSNDLIKWLTPPGLVNPIDNVPKDGAEGTSFPYNSDTHLVYNPSTNELECWYRSVYQGSNKYETIKRKKSTNGITWSNSETVMTTLGKGYNGWEYLISPAVIIENGVYKCWIMEQYYIKLLESNDGLTWTDKGFVLKKDTSDKIYTWHIDVMKNKEKEIYEMINYVHKDLSDIEGVLEHFTSTDGINWTQTPFFVSPSPDKNMWDSRSLYRSCLLYENSKYYLYYSASQTVGNSSKWQTGLSISQNDNIMSMKGIDVNYKHLMAQPTRKNPMGNIGDSVFDTTLNKMIFCVNKNGVKTWIDANGVTV